MRDYGKVHTSFWSSLTIGGLSEDGRTLALYLMTSSHTTIAGLFRLPDGYVCEDLKWSPERVAEGFRNCSEKGFANRCETTKWVWIAKHLQWNPPENPNQRKAVVKCVEQIPAECSWRADFYAAWGDKLGLQALVVDPPKIKPSGNPSATVKGTVSKPEAVAGTEVIPTTSVAGATPAVPAGDPVKLIFDKGVKLLTAAGSTDEAARSFLGKLRKEHNDVKVLQALVLAESEHPSLPVEWLTKTVPAMGGTKKVSGVHIGQQNFGQGWGK